MSVCRFIAADIPLEEKIEEHPCDRVIRMGKTASNIRDDSELLSFVRFADVDIYCEKKYGVSLEMSVCTENAAKRIMDYVNNALKKCESVEIWNVWLLEYWEFDDRPVINKRRILLDDLTENDIQSLHNSSNWQGKDKNRPIFYCLDVRKKDR